ncbi:type III ribulose-bisphosphate carboxylase [Candidatus Woesearchaeota archaeon CG10_big_fil_rev_8_21_14_0_10_34_12]|nr:MAG: type III ribulose-bisphosphate carboxylase [Candidatus Woesearchaeota archaeon CG10_big_fil_rev_8_21_14_0_10_34_12]
MKYLDYVCLNYNPKSSDLICKFYLEARNIKEAAGAVASESSTGTWTENVPGEISNLSAKVFKIRGNNVYIAYPIELFEENNIPQILSSIAGNIFGMKILKNLRLEDIEIPKQIITKFKGPKFGISGIRKLLNVPSRPLVGTIIKPKLGLNAHEHSKRAFEAWLGGCDIVKDDENLGNQKFNSFEKRIKETLKLKKEAEKITGEKKVYMPNITAETEEMLKRARFVKQHGGTYVMVDVFSCGWSALQSLRKENEKLNLVLHAHRAGHAALTRNEKHGISMLVIAKLCRLIGLDQIHIGTIIGKMEGGQEVRDIDQEIEKNLIKNNKHLLEQDWHNLKPIFAVCSGGLSPRDVPFLVKNLGKNIIIQAGGGVHSHPSGTFAGAKAMRQAIEASTKNISLEIYAEKNKELETALKFFK